MKKLTTEDTERGTPETDAVFADDDRVFDRVDRDRWRELSRKLERERDEARDRVDELTAVIKGLRAIMRQEAK